MVRPGPLILIGYWSGSETDPSWPHPEDFVDDGWDAEERELVAAYLRTGMIARTYMGYSRCRFCGRENGDLELSDGYFVWPDGLAHYLTEHGVRLPERFVRHVLDMIDGLETAQRDIEWWRQVQPPRMG